MTPEQQVDREIFLAKGMLTYYQSLAQGNDKVKAEHARVEMIELQGKLMELRKLKYAVTPKVTFWQRVWDIIQALPMGHAPKYEPRWKPRQPPRGKRTSI